jgi:hypothetical protein
MHVTLNELGNEQKQLAITIDAKDLTEGHWAKENQGMVKEIAQSFEDGGYINYSILISKFVENAESHAQPLKKYESAMGTSPTDEDQLDN